MLRTVIITALVVLAAIPQLHAQVWPHAVRLEGVRTHRHTVTLQDGTTLLPLERMKPEEKDTFYWYTVESLLSEPERYPIQVASTNIGGVTDANGNGKPDVFLTSTAFEFGAGTYMDAFEENSWLLPGKPFPQSPVPNASVRFDGDVDGDGISDVMLEWGGLPGWVWIVYGDTDEPWVEYSFVDIGERPTDDAHYAYCVGMLSGTPCVVRAYWRDRDDARLQLLRLHPDDVARRADTIRTIVIDETDEPISEVYGRVTVQGEHSWWLYGPKTCAKMTIDGGVEIVPTDRHFGQWPSRAHYKQQGAYNDPDPKIIDPTRPFILRTYGSLLPGDTLVKNGAALFRIPDPENPLPELIAQIRLGEVEPSGLEYAMLVPDLDGDAMEDLILGHWYADTIPETITHRFVDLYLSGDIVPVSVESSEHRAAKTACVLPGELARIYNVLGEHVATLPLTSRGTIAPSDLEALPQQPLWAVSGECVRRVR